MNKTRKTKQDNRVEQTAFTKSEFFGTGRRGRTKQSRKSKKRAGVKFVQTVKDSGDLHAIIMQDRLEKQDIGAISRSDN
jgi:hypothetical protein